MNSKDITLYVIYSMIFAGVYLGLAILTKPLIIPPTFAAPIWPTAGFGMGVLVLWGYRYIPALILGEILINYQFYDIELFIQKPTLFVTYGLTLFATVLRSTLGTYLVKHHLGSSNNFLTIESVTKLLIFAALIPTFISSFIASFALQSEDLFFFDSWTVNFLTWWFGDIVGISVTLPIMFLLFKKPRSIWKPRMYKIIVPVLVTFFLLVMATNNIKKLELNRLINALDKKTELLHNAVINKFKKEHPVEDWIPSNKVVEAINNIYQNKIENILTQNSIQDIHFVVYSIINESEYNIYESQNEYSEYQQWKTSKAFNFAKHTWKINAFATSESYAKNASWLVWWLTSIGFLFVALLSAGLLAITGSQLIIKSTVIKRTNEVNTLNEILKQSEKRYKQLVEIQPVIFWKHIIGEKTLDFISNEAVNILGYSKKDLKNIDVIWNKLFHPEDRYKVLDNYKNGIKSKKRFVLKYRAISKNGDIIWFKDYISSRIINERVEVIGLKIDITKDQAREQEITQLAYFDTMTGLPNRVNFMNYLEFSLSEAQKEKSFGAVLYLDLDRFKVLNDSMGHYFGDKLLVQIGERLKITLDKNDISSRFGGDEFVILLGNREKSLELINKNSFLVAEKIKVMIKEPFIIDGHKFFTSFSTGISIFPHNSDNANEIIQQADIAMYSSKEQGKNTINYFKKEMQQLANKRLNIEKSLKVALIKNEFEMYYQPIFDQDQNILKLESLIRWNHPTEGMLSPNTFIHIAEETGFIIELSEWIIENVIKQMSQWKSNKNTNVGVSINISLFQFINTQLIDMLEVAINKYGVNSKLITLELTETIGIGDFNNVLTKLNKIHEMGLKIAIDDFGTGYSSLNYLTQMPIDILKLDKSFVAKIGTKQNSDSLIETIILMAIQLDLELIVEGVETKEQFIFLKNRGCRNFQGFLFKQALPVDELEKYLNSCH